MLQLLPFLTWLAPITSAFLLIVLWHSRELRPRSLLPLLALFALAGYCQFFAVSLVAGPMGLGLQTGLAIGLMIRWKWSS